MANKYTSLEEFAQDKEELHTVAAASGYDLENHHHALADAEAASFVCLHICKEFG